MTRKKTAAKNAKKKKSVKKAPPKKVRLGPALKWLLVLALWAGIIGLALTAWYARDLPDIARASDFERRAYIVIEDSKSETVARYGDNKGEAVSVAALPPHLIYAVLATEDRRFYSHHGLDPLGVLRAVAVNLEQGRLSQGGSTITQQLAKNLFLSHERTFKRKIQEALLALWLERQLTKDEILSAYLNRVYLGSGAYGVDAAARLYFGKPATEVNLREAALLAGLLKAPSRYSPLNNPRLAEQRADVVLRAMADAGYITEEQTDARAALPPRPPPKPAGVDAVRYYTDWVVDGLDELVGSQSENLTIETTLDSNIQRAAESALGEALRAHGENRKVSQGAVLVMRPDGAVLAMVGGRSYNESQFNRVTQTRRAPGSAFKPVVYLTALEQGWKPSDTVLDAPIEQGSYRPENFGGKYLGEVSLETALTHSLNTAAVRLMQAAGRGTVIDTARKLGIISPLERDLSLALGSSGVSPLELGTAYAVLANGGMAVQPYAIRGITGKDGAIYFSRAEHPGTRRVANHRAVRNLTAMLENVIENGTGRAANLPFRAAGKTGTSQDSRDAWFAGYTDDLIVIVWLGNDDNSPMENVTGGGLPAALWKDVMLAAHDKYEGTFEQQSLVETGFRNLLERLAPALDNVTPAAKHQPLNE